MCFIAYQKHLNLITQLVMSMTDMHTVPMSCFNSKIEQVLMRVLLDMIDR